MFSDGTDNDYHYVHREGDEVSSLNSNGTSGPEDYGMEQSMYDSAGDLQQVDFFAPATDVTKVKAGCAKGSIRGRLLFMQ
jgi:uncharacterized protein YxeA